MKRIIKSSILASIIFLTLALSTSCSFTHNYRSRELISPEIKQNAGDIWNGLVDETWFSDDLEEYTISTAQELAGLSHLVNSGYSTFLDKIITLSNDIYLNDVSSYSVWSEASPNNVWTPIGINTSNSDLCFKGSFDGCGHTIYGMYIDDSVTKGHEKGELSVGLFGCILISSPNSQLSISNVTICDSLISINKTEKNFNYAGSTVGCISGGGVYAKLNGIANVLSNAVIDCSNHKPKYIGGVSGFTGANVFNSGFTGEIKLVYDEKKDEDFYLGGISAGGVIPCFVVNCYSTFDLYSLKVKPYLSGTISYQGIPICSYYLKVDDINKNNYAYGSNRREEMYSSSLAYGNGKFVNSTSSVEILEFNNHWNGSAAIYGDNRVKVNYESFSSLVIALNSFSFKDQFVKNESKNELLKKWRVDSQLNNGYPVF